jgi:hypothetical protein
LLAVKLLGEKTNIRNAHDAEMLIKASKADIENLPEDAVSVSTAKAFQQLLGGSRLSGDYFRLDRDDGDFYVYATQDRVFEGKDRATANAALDKAMAADPSLQPKHEFDPDAKQVQIGDRVFEETAGDTVRVVGTVAYYKQFTSEAAAKRAKAKLDTMRDTGAGVDEFVPTFVSNVSRRSEKLWVHDMPAPAIAKLEQIAASMPTPALQDAIRSLIAGRNRAVVSMKRDNVLGATSNIPEVIRGFAVRSGLHLREMHSHPEITRIRSAVIRDQRDRLQTTPGYTEASQQTTRILKHMDDIEQMRRDAFNDTMIKRLKRLGTNVAVVWYLSSISYYALNSAQPVIFGVPFMGARYGASGIKTLMYHVARQQRTTFRGAKTVHKSMGPRAPIDYYKSIDLRDPADLATSLGSKATTTFDPLTGEPVYMHNSHAEYDEFFRGDIDLDRLMYLSESRKLGAFGARFFEAPEALTQASDPDNAVTPYEQTVRAAKSTAKGALNAATRVVSHMAEHIEYANRRSVADAVYDMEMKKRKAAGETERLSRAEIARIAGISDELNTQINLDYSSGNRSLAQQKMGPLLLFSSFGWAFMYQSWQSFNAMARGITDQGFSRKQGTLAFLGLVGTTFAISGFPAGIPQWALLPLQAVGVTGLDTMLAQMFGLGDDDDEEKAYLDRMGFWPYAKRWVRMNFGDTTADVMFEGLVGTVLDADLTGRVNLNQGYTFAELPKAFQDEDGLVDVAFDLTGPLPGMFRSVWRNRDKLKSEGMSTALALETFAPLKVVRDAAKAWRISDEGMQDRAGKVILTPEQLDAMDIMVEAMGFTPTMIADVYRRRSLDYDVKGPVQKERDAIFTRYRKAGTPQEKRTVDLQRRQFNAQYPDYHIAIDGLRSSIKETHKTEREFQRTGGVSREKPGLAKLIGEIEGTK